MKEFDVIIIGGGASGSFCALALQKKLRVAIIDPNLFLAKKLLVTGNGRCNMTNLALKEKSFNHDLSQFFQRFDCNDAITFFENLGLKVYTDEENRVYPISNSAKSVVDVICYHLNKNNNIDIIQENVLSVNLENEKYIVKTQNQTLTSKKVVIASGGNTSKQILSDLDIDYVPCFPSLVALKTKQVSNRLDGIKVSNVKVSCKINNQNYSEFGEVLFKKNGLSGICIFNLSCFFSRNKNFNGKIFINLLPQYNFEKVYNLLKRNIQIFDNMQNALTPIMHKQLAIEILYRSGIDANCNCSQVSDKQLNLIVNNILSMEFDVIDAFDNNQVFSGGVDINQLDQNLQSKKYKNIFFCGEVCDVDGLCGGYNLQWAWTSGYIVAKALEGEND